MGLQMDNFPVFDEFTTMMVCGWEWLMRQRGMFLMNDSTEAWCFLFGTLARVFWSSQTDTQKKDESASTKGNALVNPHMLLYIWKISERMCEKQVFSRYFWVGWIHDLGLTWRRLFTLYPFLPWILYLVHLLLFKKNE